MKILIVITYLFGLCGWAYAQPSVSRGQQILPISYDDCLRRAQGAFTAEGWVNIGTSGNAVNGFKSINASYIVCNPAPDAKMAVNIFVASNATDSGVPGGERQRLQARMASPGSPQAPPSPQGLRTSCWKWDVVMKDGRRAEATLIMTSDGKVRFDRWANTGTWTAQGSTYFFDWGRGAGNKDVMTMNTGGNVLEGKNFETTSIRGTLINCS